MLGGLQHGEPDSKTAPADHGDPAAGESAPRTTHTCPDRSCALGQLPGEHAGIAEIVGLHAPHFRVRTLEFLGNRWTFIGAGHSIGNRKSDYLPKVWCCGAVLGRENRSHDKRGQAGMAERVVVARTSRRSRSCGRVTGQGSAQRCRGRPLIRTAVQPYSGTAYGHTAVRRYSHEMLDSRTRSVERTEGASASVEDWLPRH